MFFRRKEKVVAKKEGRQIGDRVAIKYGSLSTPVYYEDEHPYSCAMIKTNFHDLDMGEIADCWTVLEYIGNNQFIDLITGEIIVIQTDVDLIKDTVSIEYEDEALEKRAELLEHPIAIGSHDGYHFNGLSALTTEIKQSIMEDTMPRQEEIVSTIQKKKEEARKLITVMYDKKNKNKMHQLYNEAQREDAARTAEIERQRRLEEKRRQEEEKRLAEERLRAEIDPKFDEMFPADKRKRLFRK